MQNRSVNSNPNVQVLDVERLPENARAIIRGVLERISPIERQLLLALLAVRMHEDLGSIGHPIMMLSAHSVSKMTLWEAMQGLTDEMAKQGEAPFRTHILNVKSAVYSIMELLGAPVVEGDGVIFSFTADLDEKIRYCKEHDVPLILVFDKATKSPHILRTMLSLVKDGRFGGWQLGVPFRIVLLGDPTDWDKISEMGTALQSFADRFLYYVTTPQEELENQETTFERAHLPREMEQPQLLGAAGELEQMRAKLQSGKSARETAREHRDLMALLVLMSSPWLRSDLRMLVAKTNYRLFSALVDAMLAGDLEPMWRRFQSDPSYCPNYAAMDSDMKHMSLMRAVILADQLALLFGLGYDLESPEVERFLACNVGTPNISKIHTILKVSLAPRDEQSIASILDEAAISDDYHGRKVNRAIYVVDAWEKEGIFITHSDRAAAVNAPHTVAEFEGKKIHTIGDLIEALAASNTPPSKHLYGFKLPLHYLDYQPERIHIHLKEDGSTEVHLPGFDHHSSVVLTRGKHLLHLAKNPTDPASYAQHLTDIDQSSPLGRGVCCILGTGNPDAVKQRLQETLDEVERSINLLEKLVNKLKQYDPNDTTVQAISREAHRAAAGMALLSMFHAPVIDGETMTEIPPVEAADYFQKDHATAKQRQKEELSRLTGFSPDLVESIVSDPQLDVGILFTSGQDRIFRLFEELWGKVNDAWDNLSPDQRAEVLHSLHLLSTYGEIEQAPYGTFALRPEAFEQVKHQISEDER